MKKTMCDNLGSSDIQMFGKKIDEEPQKKIAYNDCLDAIMTRATLDDLTSQELNEFNESVNVGNTFKDNQSDLKISHELKLAHILNTGKKRSKLSKEENMLNNFLDWASVRIPRIDYYITYLVRSSKKLLKHILKIKCVNKVSQQNCISKFKYEHLRLKLTNEDQVQVFDCISNLVLNEANILSEFSLGKTHTINGEWIDKNFSDEIIRNYFELFVCYLFIGKTKNELIESLQIRCCRTISDCFCDQLKWAKLYRFTITKLIHCQIEGSN